MTRIERFPAGDWKGLGAPRIQLPNPRSLSLITRLVLRRIRATTKSGSDFNVFLMLAKSGRIFPGHAVFISQLLGKTRISEIEKELTILRSAWRLGAHYEWGHHAHMAGDLGIAPETIAAQADPAPRTCASRIDTLTVVADELLATRELGDDTWAAARRWLSEDELVEACLLVGHYVMVAFALNATRIDLEPEFAPTGSAR
ncbi:MAG TPA: hypothetical protein VF426_08240 [Marmoricola sp.]